MVDIEVLRGGMACAVENSALDVSVKERAGAKAEQPGERRAENSGGGRLGRHADKQAVDDEQ